MPQGPAARSRRPRVTPAPAGAGTRAGKRHCPDRQPAGLAGNAPRRRRRGYVGQDDCATTRSRPPRPPRRPRPAPPACPPPRPRRRRPRPPPRPRWAATIGQQARAAISTSHTCTAPAVPPPPHGPGVVITGSMTVLINNLPACRQGDTILEAVGPPNTISMGLPTVIIGDSMFVGQGGALAMAAQTGAPFCEH